MTMNTIYQEKSKQTTRIFLSYVAADREYAHKLHNLLSQHSDLYIFTLEMLSAGDNWESKLKDEISKSDIFIVLLSSRSVNSNWVLHELGAAWALNKPIIPVVIHGDVFSQIPLPLRQMQLIEFKEFEKPEVINKILEQYEKVETSSY